MSFGPLNSGLVGSVSYQVIAVDGTVLIGSTTAGITEAVAGSGLYSAVISVDYGWGFVTVLWEIASRSLAESDIFQADDLTLITNPPAVSGPATFDPTLSTQKDMVRMRIGDLNGQPQWFLADATITAMLGMYTYDETCAQCAESIGAICAQLAQSTDQPNLKITYQARSSAMYKLADRIRDLAQPSPSEPVNYGALTTSMAEPDLHDYLMVGPGGPCHLGAPWGGGPFNVGP